MTNILVGKSNEVKANAITSAIKQMIERQLSSPKLGQHDVGAIMTRMRYSTTYDHYHEETKFAVTYTMHDGKLSHSYIDLTEYMSDLATVKSGGQLVKQLEKDVGDLLAWVILMHSATKTANLKKKS